MQPMSVASNSHKSVNTLQYIKAGKETICTVDILQSFVTRRVVNSGKHHNLLCRVENANKWYLKREKIPLRYTQATVMFIQMKQ